MPLLAPIVSEPFPMDSHVIVFPEAAQAKSLKHPIYARVLKARSKNPQLRKVRTIAVLESEHTDAIPSSDMFVEIDSIRAVTSTEALSSTLGYYVRSSVAACVDDNVIFGQVVHHDFTNGTLFVHSNTGIVEIPNHHFRLINAVVAMFLFNTTIPITDHINLDTIEDAAKEFVTTLLEVDNVLDNLPSFFQPFHTILGNHHMAPTSDIHWIDPSSGYHHKCTVLHVLQWTHYIDGNRECPKDITLANTFCGDPCYDNETFPTALLSGSFKSLASQPPSPPKTTRAQRHKRTLTDSDTPAPSKPKPTKTKPKAKKPKNIAASQPISQSYLSESSGHESDDEPFFGPIPHDTGKYAVPSLPPARVVTNISSNRDNHAKTKTQRKLSDASSDTDTKPPSRTRFPRKQRSSPPPSSPSSESSSSDSSSSATSSRSSHSRSSASSSSASDTARRRHRRPLANRHQKSSRHRRRHRRRGRDSESDSDYSSSSSSSSDSDEPGALMKTRRHQRAVHRAISAKKFRLLPPQQFVDTVMNDETLLFTKRPPVVAHLYDMRQGQFTGMSVMHCRPVDQRALDANRFDDEAPIAKFTAALQRPQRPTSLQDIRQAYDVLADYWDTYGSRHVRRFVDAGTTLLKYIHRQPCWAGTWMALANWIDRQFAEFRDTVARDLRNNTFKHKSLHKHFDPHGRVFDKLLRRVHREATATQFHSRPFSLSTHPPPTQAAPGGGSPDNTDRPPRSKAQDRAPIDPHTLAALPLDSSGKQLCMLHCTKKGCGSKKQKESGLCKFNRGHFKPSMTPTLRAAILKRYKDIRSDYDE